MSYPAWEQIKHLFTVVDGEVVPSTTAGISDDKLRILQQYIPHAMCVSLGFIQQGNQNTRIHGIAPILFMVCSHFGSGVELKSNVYITGNNIRIPGFANLLIKRGAKQICLVE